MPGQLALPLLAASAALLVAIALGAGAARAADPLVIDHDGTVRLGAAGSGIVVDPAGGARLGASGNGLVVDPAGAVRIGSATAPPLVVDGPSVKIGTSLNFGQRQGSMLTLWDPGTAIGVQSSTMYFRSYGNFAWFNRGTHADAALAPGEGGTTLMSLASTPTAGRGTLDVGGSVSARSLDLRAAERTGDGHPTAAPILYLTGDFPYGRPEAGAAPGVEFRHSNGTQGIGFGYNTIYATGSIADQQLRLEARGKGNVTGKGAVPAGAILMWSGDAASIPPGWVLCDGGNDTPDLSGRFVVGYQKDNPDYAVGKTGGEATHTLTLDEMPRHDHGEAGQHVHTLWASGHGWAFPVVQTGDSRVRDDSHTVTTSAAGAHRHNLEGGGRPHENRPPCYALAYIMYTGK